MGFTCGSAGKESTCNEGDLGLIPVLGRSRGEENSYPLQYSGLENSMDCIGHAVAKSQTSLVAQTVKRLPTMWETWFQSLGGEDALEKEMATHSCILAWEVPWTEESGGLQAMASQSRTRLSY